MNATVGHFVVAYRQGFGRVATDKYATEADARTVAATLWSSWVIFHEQRGAMTEIAMGGWGFGHGALRKGVRSAMQHNLNMKAMMAYPSAM